MIEQDEIAHYFSRDKKPFEMKKVALALFASLMLSSCVTSKIHNELQSKYNEIEKENSDLKSQNETLKSDLEIAQADLKRAKEQLNKLTRDSASRGQAYRSLQEKYRELNKNYEFLLENNSALLASNQAENKKLIAKLDLLQKALHAKEDSLAQEQLNLDYLSREMQKREARVNELESLIAQRDAQVNAVRQKLQEALFNFEGKGLTVEMRDGKVYVSLENSLLFASGSWTIDGEGKKALQELAKVLAENKDLNVMVEGHTDSDKFNGKTAVKDNWDLSVMRATAIVKIITENDGVDPAKITAAGKSEYIPVSDNETAEGKAKNRRTEIIITPDLDKIVKVLGEVK